MSFYFDTPPERTSVIERVHNLNDEQVKDLTEAFQLIDTEKTGVILINNLGKLMRAVAHNVSESELHELLNEYDPEMTGDLRLNDFLVIMSNRYQDMTPEDEVILAFRVFDREGNGFIKETEFKYIMSTYGDKLDENELNDIILDADPDTEGNIHYANFVAMMMEK